MKKVNRIRFDSLTSNSSSDFDVISVTQGAPTHRARRPRSCPPLKRQGHLGQAVGDGTSGTRVKPKQHTSAGERMVYGKGLGKQISMIEPKVIGDFLQNEDSSDDIASYSTGELFYWRDIYIYIL